MSIKLRQNLLSWRAIIAKDRAAPDNSQRRRLAFETLEDRRMMVTRTVNTLLDVVNGSDGLVSLREAVTNSSSGDMVAFSVTGTIELTSLNGGHLVIDNDLVIQGPGAHLLTVKAYDPDSGGTNDSDGRRIFLVDDGDSDVDNVIISGLTLINGDPQLGELGENQAGGAIRNRENLTINNCVITGNFTLNGGAIYSQDETLTINDSTISGNAAQDGGGILLNGGTVHINRSTIHGNTATNVGGGILSRSGTVNIVDSTISGNSASFDNEEAGYGGGIASYYGTLNVTTSTISGNTVGRFGGGIFLSGGDLTLTSSTISGNSAIDQGGGIFSDTGNTINIRHSTIALNSVGGGREGGGIRSPNTANLFHSIVAGNLAGSIRDDVSGSFDATYSLVGDKDGATVDNVTGSLIGTTSSPINAMLGPLADNGGRTKTHALLLGSPAIDSGNSSAVAGSGGISSFDQRGSTPFSRVVNGDGAGGARIDMGAYEKGAAATYTVDIAGDENDFNYAASDLSLREALIIANGNPGILDSIAFHASLSGATILLTLGELRISDNVNINGLGANVLTVDASGNDPTPAVNEGNGSRVFFVDDEDAATALTVSISGMRLTGGDVAGEGGAVLIEDNTLNLANMLISGNAAGSGGGVAANAGTLSILTSTISANQASSTGGGVKNNQSNVTVTDSTISGNTAATNGGGVWSDTNLSSQTTTIVGSTISGNTATTSGGGLFNSDGRTVLRHVTITNNTAPAAGGGGVGSAGNSSTRTEVRSTIIAADANTDVALVGGSTNSFQSNGYNLVGTGHTTGNPINEFVETGDQRGTNPIFGALANNSGPTFTHLLMPGSAAINLGDPAAVAGSGGVPLYDQRGNPNGRVLAGRIDIGAVEMVPPPPPALPGDFNLDEVVDSADYVTWRKTQGSTVPQYSGADGNGDMLVNQDDFLLWRANFGNSLPGAGSGASSEAASEPTTTAVANDEAQSTAQAIGAWFVVGQTSRAASPRFVRTAPAGAVSELRGNLLLAIDSLFEPGDDQVAFESDYDIASEMAGDDDSARDAIFSDAFSERGAFWPSL